MNHKMVFVGVLLFLVTSLSLAQETSNLDKLKFLNSETEQAFLNKDINRILKYYDNESVVMPEYHKTLYGKENIRNYFKQWLETVNTSSFKRIIYEVQLINACLLETGTFKNEFISPGKDAFTYEGKYIRIWKIGTKNQLTIISEIWGSSSYLDRLKLPFIGNNISDNTPDYKVSKKIKEAVIFKNQIITELVKNRDGEKHSTFFTNDVIYMPYYMPMIVGIEKVRSYFIEHEKPGDVQIDSLVINTSKIIELGDFILEHGYYRIRGKGENNTSWVVTGKSINLWRRDEKENLLIYRQMVNHD